MRNCKRFQTNVLPALYANAALTHDVSSVCGIMIPLEPPTHVGLWLSIRSQIQVSHTVKVASAPNVLGVCFGFRESTSLWVQTFSGTLPWKTHLEILPHRK